MAIAQELINSNVLTMCVTEDDFDNFFKSAINYNEDFIYEEDDEDIPVEVLTTNGCDIRSKDENITSEKGSDYNKGPQETSSSQSPVDSRKRNVMFSVNEIPPKKKKTDFQPPKLKEPNRDIFCWKCHKFGLDILSCRVCPRVYHFKCTQLEEKPNNWLCFECSEKQKSDVNIKSSMHLVGLDQFSKLLTFVLRRMRQHEKSVYFENPVDLGDYPDYRYYIVKPMCLYDLEQNISNRIYYSCESFLSDAQWLVHNSYIFNTAQSELTVIARSIMKMAKHECGEINNCPDCYLHANTLKTDEWFLECCRVPHILVWARLKGWPYWPCKVMSASGINVDVRFFGDHNRAVVPADSCYLFSKQMPGKQKKCLELELAVEEARKHIEKLEQKFGKFVYPPPRVEYVPRAEDLHRKFLLPEYKNDSDTLLDSPTAKKLKSTCKAAVQLEEDINVPHTIYKNSKPQDKEIMNNSLNIQTSETPKKSPIKTHSFSNKLSLIIEPSDIKSSKISSNIKPPNFTFEKPCPASKKRVKFSECIQVIPIEKLDNLVSSKEDAIHNFSSTNNCPYSGMSNMSSEIDKKNKIKSILRSSKKYTEPYEDPKLKSYCSVNVKRLKLDPDYNYKSEDNLSIPRNEGLLSPNGSFVRDIDVKKKSLMSVVKSPLRKTDITYFDKANICEFLNNLKSDSSTAKFIQRKISQNRGNILHLNNKPFLTKTSLPGYAGKDIKLHRNDPVPNVSILNKHSISSMNTCKSGIHKATPKKCSDEKRPVNRSEIKICHNGILKSLLIPKRNTFMCNNSLNQSNINDQKKNNFSKNMVVNGLVDNKSTSLNEPKKVIKILGPRKMQESLSFDEKQINTYLNNLISDVEVANSVKLKILGNRDSSLKNSKSYLSNKKENFEKLSLSIENQKVEFDTLKNNSEKHEHDYSSSEAYSPPEFSSQNIISNTFPYPEKRTSSMEVGPKLISSNGAAICTISNLSNERLTQNGECVTSNSSSTTNISKENTGLNGTVGRILMKQKEGNSNGTIENILARNNIKSDFYKGITCKPIESETSDFLNTMTLKTLNRASNSKPQNIPPWNTRQVSYSNISKGSFLGRRILSQEDRDLLSAQPTEDNLMLPSSSALYASGFTEMEPTSEENRYYDTMEKKVINDGSVERKFHMKVETPECDWNKGRSKVENKGCSETALPDNSLSALCVDAMENKLIGDQNLDDIQQLDILLKQWNLSEEVSKIVKSKVIEIKNKFKLVPKSRLKNSESVVNVPSIGQTSNICAEESSIKFKGCDTSFSDIEKILSTEKRLDQKSSDNKLIRSNHTVFDKSIPHGTSEVSEVVSDISTEYMVLDPVANIFTVVPESLPTSTGESNELTAAFTDTVIKFFCQAYTQLKNVTSYSNPSDLLVNENIKPFGEGHKQKRTFLRKKFPLHNRMHKLKGTSNPISENCNSFIHSRDGIGLSASFEIHSGSLFTERNKIRSLGSSNFRLYRDIEKESTDDVGDEFNKSHECLETIDLTENSDQGIGKYHSKLNENDIFGNRYIIPCSEDSHDDDQIIKHIEKDLKYQYNAGCSNFKNQPSTSQSICDEIEDSPLHNELYELTEWSLNMYFNNIIESIKTGNPKTALDHSRTLAQEHSKLQEMFNPHIDDKMEFHKQKFIEDVMYEAKRECNNLIDRMKKTQLCSICHDPAKIFCCFTGAYCSEQCKNRHSFTHHKECSKIQLQVEEPSILSCRHLRQLVQENKHMKVKDLMEGIEKFPDRVLLVDYDMPTVENNKDLNNEKLVNLESDIELIYSDCDLPLEVIISSPPPTDTTSNNLNSIISIEEEENYHSSLQDVKNDLSNKFNRSQINSLPNKLIDDFRPIFNRKISSSLFPGKQSSHLRKLPNSYRKLPLINKYHTVAARKIEKFRSKNYFKSQIKSRLFSSKRALALSSRMKLSRRHIGLRHQMLSRRMTHSYASCSRLVDKSTIASQKPLNRSEEKLNEEERLKAEERMKAVYITMLREKMKYVQIPKRDPNTSKNSNVDLSEKWKHINLALVNKILSDGKNSNEESAYSCCISCKGNCSQACNNAQPSTSQGI